MRRIQHLEDTIRSQEELVLELQEKLDTVDTPGNHVDTEVVLQKVPSEDS